MADQDKNQTSLRQRINDYLRGPHPQRNISNASLETTDTALLEYQLKRAEAELRQAQARVDQLRLDLQNSGRKRAVSAKA